MSLSSCFFQVKLHKKELKSITYHLISSEVNKPGENQEVTENKIEKYFKFRSHFETDKLYYVMQFNSKAQSPAQGYYLNFTACLDRHLDGKVCVICVKCHNDIYIPVAFPCVAIIDNGLC